MIIQVVTQTTFRDESNPDTRIDRVGLAVDGRVQWFFSHDHMTDGIDSYQVFKTREEQLKRWVSSGRRIVQ